jgi:hypothetical protein
MMTALGHLFVCYLSSQYRPRFARVNGQPKVFLNKYSAQAKAPLPALA